MARTSLPYLSKSSLGPVALRALWFGRVAS
jgi:hypothetical protein